MSILFVVHQNFSHSINCVFFFPSQQKEPVTFPNPSSLILFSSSFLHPTSSVHILLTTATFSQWHHGWSLLITVFSSWGTVFFFFLILERLGSLNLHYELIELKGNWCQTNVCSCSVTRRADVMSVYPTVLLDGSKKKKCSLKNRPLRIYFADATVARVWRTVLPVSSREHRGHLTALFTCHVTSPRRWRAAASQPFDLPRLNFNPVIEKVILSSLSDLFFLASVAVLQHAVHAAGREEI